MQKPDIKYFSSGPTAKPKGWTLEILKEAMVSRSHRSKEGKEKIREVLHKTRLVLEIPDSYKIAIVPGSATGAMTMLLWSLLGERGVDVFSFDVFSHRWLQDIRDQLKLEDVRSYEGFKGDLPDFSKYDATRDIVFAWNGSTSGTCVKEASWIKEDREALTICDATSATFAARLPWERLDATAFSWQKGLGSEAAHGMVVLSPLAIERLETYTPPWPVPYQMSFKKGNDLNEGLFEGLTLNTPSLLAIEDYLYCLNWALDLKGLPGLLKKTEENGREIAVYVEEHPDIICLGGKSVSPTTVCLTFQKAGVISEEEQYKFYQEVALFLAEQDVAYDILNHKSGVPSLRVWAGPTIEANDLKCLMPWISHAFDEIWNKNNLQKAG